MSDSECSSDDCIPLAKVKAKIKEVNERQDHEFIKDIIETVIKEAVLKTQSSDEYCDRLRKRTYKDSEKDSENCDIDFDDDFSYDSDKDPEFKQTCEVRCCKKEVWAACHKCLILVCWEHFNEEVESCNDHGSIKKANKTKM